LIEEEKIEFDLKEGSTCMQEGLDFIVGEVYCENRSTCMQEGLDFIVGEVYCENIRAKSSNTYKNINPANQ